MNQKIRNAALTVKNNALPIASCAAVFATTYLIARRFVNTDEVVEAVTDGIVVPHEWFEKLNQVGGAYLMQINAGDFLLTKANI